MKNLNVVLLVFVCLQLACQTDQKKKQHKANNVFYDQAFEFRDLNKLDSAFSYFNKAKDIFILQKDSLGVAKCFSNMAYILYNKSDDLGAQELCLSANLYFDKTKKAQHPYLQSNYNILGLATEHLANYNGAILFYQQSLIYSTDSKNILIVKNNIANVYRRNEEYQKSLDIYKNILTQTIDQIEFARVLSNQAYTMWLQNPTYNASPNLRKSLQIRSMNKDEDGKNASYAHLSDYYQIKNPDSALFYAALMYQTAKQMQSPYDQLQALQKLIRFSGAAQAKQYFSHYLELVDSVQISNNKSKYQFAIIRYDSEKNKAENLVLQKDNAEKKYQIARREILFGITFLTLITGSIIAILWYKKRKQKLELESQNTIRENQLRTSKKVHDVVANGLYRVMTEIENREGIDKEHILDKIDDMYQKSRDISYDKPQTTSSHFNDKLTKLLLAFETGTIKVVALGNTIELWQKVTPQVKYEIEHILQELMVNMDKHSQATEVSIKFYKKDKFISIHYNDNGTGLSENVIYNNGLTNTETRIKNISGTITFETIQNKGLEILISFPIH